MEILIKKLIAGAVLIQIQSFPIPSRGWEMSGWIPTTSEDQSIAHRTMAAAALTPNWCHWSALGAFLAPPCRAAFLGIH